MNGEHAVRLDAIERKLDSVDKKLDTIIENKGKVSGDLVWLTWVGRLALLLSLLALGIQAPAII